MKPSGYGELLSRLGLAKTDGHDEFGEREA